MHHWIKGGKKMVNLRNIESKNKYGNMNGNASFYPEGWTKEQIQEEFLRHRLAFGKDFGFDGHKMFMADQKDSSEYLRGKGTKIGTHFEITEDYVHAFPNGWSDIDEDILVIRKETPGVVIGQPVSDCPVVMMSDLKNGITAIAHCNAKLVDEKLPMMIADALVDNYGCRENDLYVYVSACAGPSWCYDQFPGFAKDTKLWNDAIAVKKIKTKDGYQSMFYIDIRRAISKELKERKLNSEQIIYNMDDTITNPNYYSNSASSEKGRNDKTKAGRHFAGAFYEEIPLREKIKERIMTR